MALARGHGGFVGGLVCAAALFVACSSSSSGPPARTIQSGGHACTDQAGPGADTVSCDGGKAPASRPSGACASPATLCWTVGPMAMQLADGGFTPTQTGLCAACCNGTNPGGGPNASYNAAYDCTPISCATDNDCPYESSGCSGGACR